MIAPEFAFIISIALVVFGQILNAITVLIDKYIVTKTTITKPGVYVFYVGVLSGVVLILAPFGVIHLPDARTIFLSLDIGFVFILSILFLFRALKHANATDVVAWLTAISVTTTFIFSAVLMDEQLPVSFLYAMALFITGILFVGHFRFYARSFFQVIVAGVLFGLSAVLLKILFSEVSFLDGFFWSRVGNLLAALSLLFFPSIRNHVFAISRNTSSKTGVLIVGNRIIGGLAFLLILYAIKIGSVSIVNALSSLQFLFIFLLIFFLGKYMPELYHREFRPGHVLHKILAMCFIMAGFFVLFI
ncbi:MAG: hypothetical protein Q7S34_00860 [bacterium]|nr:hypothetical protein [bacterium]